MPHVLVAGKIHEAGVARLRAAPGVTFDLVDEVSTASYAPLVDKADAILIRTQPMPADVIQKAGRLKIVSRHGVGYDAVDVEALNRRHIPLAIVGDVNSRPVAEHAMMMMLSFAKRTAAYDAATRRGDWNYRNSYEAKELAGKTLLLIGFGRIGRIVARMAAAFEMVVQAHDPYQSETEILKGGAEPAPDLAAALGAADYVSVHAPLAGNNALLGQAELAKMKPTAVIINTARGGLVDESALAGALETGSIAGAALDVFVDEPPSTDHPLLRNARTILSPHSAGLTEECAARMSTAAVQNILDFFADRIDPSVVVNGAHVPRLAFAS
jgi:D-3-phosphoglycerate dehydrogenase